ncbi:hypothetical protein [Leptolyngbya sp. PCC 6406]|nr:hypothetical protein [Leptolyngbya sp. PCC 6406]
MAEAIGYFIKRFIRELQINDVSDSIKVLDGNSLHIPELLEFRLKP